MQTTPSDAEFLANATTCLNDYLKVLDEQVEGLTGFTVNQIFIERDYHAEGKPLKARIIVEVKDGE